MVMKVVEVLLEVLEALVVVEMVEKIIVPTLLLKHLQMEQQIQVVVAVVHQTEM